MSKYNQTRGRDQSKKMEERKRRRKEQAKICLAEELERVNLLLREQAQNKSQLESLKSGHCQASSFTDLGKIVDQSLGGVAKASLFEKGSIDTLQGC